MRSLEGVFDRSGRLRRPPLSRLPREVASYFTYHPARPDPASLPHGGGHRVMVIPGLMTTDGFTLPLRRFLNACGYRSYGWSQGPNLGPTARHRKRLREQLDRLCDEEGGPVSVIGISMGGILARDLAHDRAQQVRRLVSIVSPTHFPTASHAEHLVNALRPFYTPDMDPEAYGRPVAMPALHLYSRDDGLIAWESCMGRDPEATTVEVSGRHVSICRNPAVLRSVAEFLQPEQG